VHDRGAQVDTHGSAQVIGRGAQASSRGGARWASQGFDRGAQAVARGVSHFFSHVLGRGARAVGAVKPIAVRQGRLRKPPLLILRIVSPGRKTAFESNRPQPPESNRAARAARNQTIPIFFSRFARIVDCC
jgi:hypothetical protein